MILLGSVAAALLRAVDAAVLLRAVDAAVLLCGEVAAANLHEVVIVFGWGGRHLSSSPRFPSSPDGAGGAFRRRRVVVVAGWGGRHLPSRTVTVVVVAGRGRVRADGALSSGRVAYWSCVGSRG